MVDMGKNVDDMLHLWGVLVERQKLITHEHLFGTYISVVNPQFTRLTAILKIVDVFQKKMHSWNA